MSEKTALTTEDAPLTDHPYSQGVHAGDFVYVSGFGPVEPETLAEVEGDVTAQTQRCLENIEAVLAEADASLADAVKLTVYLDDMDDYDAMNDAYAEYVEGPVPPARVCVETARLPGDVAVEIDAVAYVPTS
ncbi:RidA family protein [Halobacterium sp. CBA1126]|uniref:RidA family protein n=1 Tax=Halobacterium TaxID=2239 RepID=UPI0012F79917|nr:RidA family protein [Halobacterium sp. CBA1126]MUV59321.1 RidA family protein [Halobacterium sp. CBA1126]